MTPIQNIITGNHKRMSKKHIVVFALEFAFGIPWRGGPVLKGESGHIHGVCERSPLNFRCVGAVLLKTQVGPISPEPTEPSPIRWNLPNQRIQRTI